MTKEMLRCAAMDVLVLLLLGFLFYRSIPMMVIMALAGTPFLIRKQRFGYEETLILNLSSAIYKLLELLEP